MQETSFTSLTMGQSAVIACAPPVNKSGLCRDLKEEFGFSSQLVLEAPASFIDDIKNFKSPFTGYGVKATKGLSKNMEDSYSVQEKLSSPSVDIQLPSSSPRHQDTEPEDNMISIPGFSEDLSLFSVFDGHGGDEVAQHCSDRLHSHFSTRLEASICRKVERAAERDEQALFDRSLSSSLPVLNSFEVAIESTSHGSAWNVAVESTSPRSGDVTCPTALVTDALRASFCMTDEELKGTEEGEFVGATAVVVVVGKTHIWVAHCGDSRAVMQSSGDTIPLTDDHKPNREDEASRIKDLGGKVVSNRVQGFLAMSRAIGDHYMRPFVIAEPEVSCRLRSSEDEVLIIATDGLWDVFSCTEATSLASRCITRCKLRGMSMHGGCRVAASVLAKNAMERGSRDNITVIVVDLTLQPSSEAGTEDEGSSAGEAVPRRATMTRSSSCGVASSRALGEREVSNSSSKGKYVLLKSQPGPGSKDSRMAPPPSRRHLSGDAARHMSSEFCQNDRLSAIINDERRELSPLSLARTPSDPTHCAFPVGLLPTEEESEEADSDLDAEGHSSRVVRLKSSASSGLEDASGCSVSAEIALRMPGSEESDASRSGGAGPEQDGALAKSVIVSDPASLEPDPDLERGSDPLRPDSVGPRHGGTSTYGLESGENEKSSRSLSAQLSGMA